MIWAGLNSKDGSKEENDLSGLSSKVSSSAMLLTPQSEDEILQASNLKNFTFNELRTATRNFRPDSMVGEGGFGCVFKGWIDEHTLAPTKPGTGMVIAVKRLNQESNQGHIEWLVSVTFHLAWSFTLWNFAQCLEVKLVSRCVSCECDPCFFFCNACDKLRSTSNTFSNAVLLALFIIG